MNCTSLGGGEEAALCVFSPRYVWEEEKSKLEGLLNSVGQPDLSLSDVPRQPLPLHYSLICHESSIQTERDEVCQSSLFRVKFIFFSRLYSPTPLLLSISLPPHLLLLLPFFFFFFFTMLQIQTCNSRRDLRPALMGDGAHLLNVLPITASLSLCPDSKLEIWRVRAEK